MTSIAQADDGLSKRELDALEALENRMAQGTSVRWDEPKTIRGFLIRPVESVTVPDYADRSLKVEKQVATLRTAAGLEAIWSGPAALEDLFQVEGCGQPVIVDYRGEKIAQESGQQYKDIKVVIGETPAAMPEDAGPPDDIPFAA